jgi:Protein of unknown function (DUF3180)
VVTAPRPIGATRVRDLAAVAAVAGLIGWLVVREWYGEIPKLRWFLPLSLALLAIAEALAASQLRARIRRVPGTWPVPPLVAARSLALAKASALVGAAMVGVWAGLLVYTVPRLGVLAAAGDDTRTGVLGVVASLSLVCSALWLEYCCRTPKPPDRSSQHPRSGDDLS